MNLEHVIKISQFIFPITRVNDDGSIMVESAGFRARFIPGRKKLVFTDVKGRIKSIKVG